MFVKVLGERQKAIKLNAEYNSCQNICMFPPRADGDANTLRLLLEISHYKEKKKQRMKSKVK